MGAQTVASAEDMQAASPIPQQPQERLAAISRSLLRVPSAQHARRARLLGMRADVHAQQGALGRAQDDLREALGLARDVPRLHIELKSMFASVLLQSGALAESGEQLRELLLVARADEFPAERARALNDLGVLLGSNTRIASNWAHANGRFAPASPLAAFKASAQLAAREALPRLAARARLNASRVLAGQRELVQASSMLRDAIEAIHSTPDDLHKADALIAYTRVAGLLHQAGPHRSADSTPLLPARYSALQQALALADQAGHARTTSLALGALADLYAEQDRVAEAAQLLDRALAVAHDVGAFDLTYQWLGALASLRDSQGDSGGAFRAYRAAIAVLRAQRVDLVTTLPGPSGYFDRVVRPVYLGFVDLLLRESAGLQDDTARQRVLSEARAVVELFKSAELENYFQDDCVAELQARARSLDDLPDHTAVIYPIALSNRLEVLLSLSSGLSRHTVEVGREEVVRTARSFRELVERPSLSYRRPGQRLHKWLLGGLGEQLAGVDTLVFVPDDTLRGVPFAAIHDGHQHLVERFAIATVPGLSLLDSGPLQRERGDVLIGGLSVPVQGFEPLPNVAREIDALQAMLGGTVLRDDRFLANAVNDALDSRPYSVIHIASHAEFGATARSSFVLTFDGRLTMDGLERLIKLSRFRDQPVELLTLSACETAAGDERASLGLAGIAIKAGARSTLASLWLVNDEAAAELMLSFHRHLRGGASKAGALRIAQRELMSRHRFRYPRSWAPFVLLGNWQ